MLSGNSKTASTGVKTLLIIGRVRNLKAEVIGHNEDI
jgi:hypothetical protein